MIKYNHDKMEWEGLTIEQIQFWEKTYPKVNVVDQLHRMIAWLDANPSKAHKKQWKRFINNWLSRS